jgi:glycosyltransferase involved in cell wall biosynthesis
MLSIIVPVYNEENTIQLILRKLNSLPIPKEIIVVNDGSKDSTLERIKDIKEEIPIIRVIDLKTNQGKGKAVREGIRASRGEVIAVQDADLEYKPQDLVNLYNIIIHTDADAVYGIRFVHDSHSPFWHRMGNKILSLATSVLYFKNIRDMETCYKVIKRDVLLSLKLESNRFEIEAEITAKLLRKGFKIVQHPISYRFRSYREGKKISWQDGIKAIITLLKYRFKNSV